MTAPRIDIPVSIPDVHVLNEGQALVCEYQGRRFGLPPHLILEGSEVHGAGDVGRLVVPAWFAEELLQDLPD